jgi:hypothetical protein
MLIFGDFSIPPFLAAMLDLRRFKISQGTPQYSGEKIDPLFVKIDRIVFFQCVSKEVRNQ